MIEQYLVVVDINDEVLPKDLFYYIVTAESEEEAVKKVWKHICESTDVADDEREGWEPYPDPNNNILRKTKWGIIKMDYVEVMLDE